MGSKKIPILPGLCLEKQFANTSMETIEEKVCIPSSESSVYRMCGMWNIHRVEVAQCIGAEGMFWIVPHDLLQDGVEISKLYSVFSPPCKGTLFFRTVLDSTKN